MKKLLTGIIFFLFFTCCKNQIKNYPEDISRENLESIFDDAKWEVYKWNLLNGEDYLIRDTVLTNFESLPLYYKGTAKNGDTLTIKFDFSNFEFDPIKTSLMTDVSFVNSRIVGLDLFDHLGVVYSETDTILDRKYESKFTKYLQSKEPSELNPWLLKEARKRGVLK